MCWVVVLHSVCDDVNVGLCCAVLCCVLVWCDVVLVGFGVGGFGCVWC